MTEKVYSAPQVVFHDAPEVVRDQAGLEFHSKNHQAYELATDGDHVKSPKKILGLRPLIFWLILLLIVVVVAVGGGVGGSMASKSGSKSSPGSIPDSVTSPSSVSSVSSSTKTDAFNIAGTPTSSTTNEASQASTASAASPTQTRGWTGCPESNGTRYTSYGSEFTILCDMLWAWGGSDLANPATLNLQQCMDQCGMWNQAYAPQSVCYLAVFGKQYTDTAYKNCWMKSVPLGGNFTMIDDTTVAAGMVVNPRT